MKHDTDMDPLLKQALSPKEQPRDWLDQNILRQAKEIEHMKENNTKKNITKRIPATALIAAAILFTGSVTAVATWKYLAPDKVAEVLEDKGLAAAFQSKDAVSLNESQEFGEYKITLLGILSGKNLTQYVSTEDAGSVRDDRTYVVTAIENLDGSPRPAVSDESYGTDPFFVSPLIEGQDPNWFNIITMGGGYSEIVQDGIQYRITETDNVEAFADRTLYLAVCSGTFYDQGAYQFDQATGQISRNESYGGVNALFCLPLDSSKADKEAAEAYIQRVEKELFGEGGSGSPEGAGEGTAQPEGEDGECKLQAAPEGGEGLGSSLTAEIEGWTEEELEANTDLLEELAQVLKPDAEGNITYSYEVSKDGLGASGNVSLEMLFEDGQEGMSPSKQIIGGDGEEGAYIETFTLNEDGTVTLKVYQYRK